MTVVRSPFRLIATDVDGTLVNSDKTITDATKLELRRVSRDYGVVLVLVSTRMPRSLALICEALAIDCPIIAYGGSLIMPGQGAPPIYSTQIEDHLAVEVIRELLSREVHVGVFSGDRWFVSSVDYWALREVHGTGIVPQEKLLHLALQDGDVLPVSKVMVRGSARDVSQAIGAVKARGFDVGISRESRDTVAEFTNSAVSKGVSLERLLTFLEIPSSSVLAFGDGYNDISMLELAGWGVAMENAPAEVRACADETTLSNDEDGVGRSMRKFFPVAVR